MRVRDGKTKVIPISGRAVFLVEGTIKPYTQHVLKTRRREGSIYVSKGLKRDGIRKEHRMEKWRKIIHWLINTNNEFF